MSLTVRVIAPTGRDAELVVSVLRENGLHAEVRRDLSFLSSPAGGTIGPLLIAEEALVPPFLQQLSTLVAGQPEWSDHRFRDFDQWRPGNEPESPHELRTLANSGSPVLLERPIRAATLVSSVRAALRARKRQYEIRDTLRDRDVALTELKQERETLQVVLDNVPVGILLVGRTGNVILGNRSAARILGHSIGDMLEGIPQQRWVVYHPDGRRVAVEEFPLRRAMSNGRAIPPKISISARRWFTGMDQPGGSAHFQRERRGDGGRGCHLRHRHPEARRFQSAQKRRAISAADRTLDRGHDPWGLRRWDLYANPAILDLLGYSMKT